jgi:transcriptional regulator with XRE-family HTH domain
MKAGALVARNIRRLRVARGLSQEVLAVDAEIDRTYVSRLERGLAVLERLAKALSANIEEFFKVPRAGEAASRPLKGAVGGQKVRTLAYPARRLSQHPRTPTLHGRNSELQWTQLRSAFGG